MLRSGGRGHAIYESASTHCRAESWLVRRGTCSSHEVLTSGPLALPRVRRHHATARNGHVVHVWWTGVCWCVLSLLGSILANAVARWRGLVDVAVVWGGGGEGPVGKMGGQLNAKIAAASEPRRAMWVGGRTTW